VNERTGLAGADSARIPPEQWKKIDAIIEKYKNKEGTLIPVLKETQEVTGYLPLEVQKYIAEGMKLHPS